MSKSELPLRVPKLRPSARFTRLFVGLGTRWVPISGTNFDSSDLNWLRGFWLASNLANCFLSHKISKWDSSSGTLRFPTFRELSDTSSDSIAVPVLGTRFFTGVTITLFSHRTGTFAFVCRLAKHARSQGGSTGSIEPPLSQDLVCFYWTCMHVTAYMWLHVKCECMWNASFYTLNIAKIAVVLFSILNVDIQLRSSGMFREFWEFKEELPKNAGIFKSCLL